MTTTAPISVTTARQRDRLLERLRGLGSALVAFSGGVDSGTLLKAAVVALAKGKALGITVVGDIFPSYEVKLAVRIAREHGFPHRLVEMSPIELEEFTSNPPERCYYCKRFLFSRLAEAGRAEGFDHVLDGSNADDVGDHRPGLRAVAELNILSPLKELGITKAQTREMARAWGLPNWDEPSAACLASRV